MESKLCFSGNFKKRMFFLAFLTGIIISTSMPSTYLVLSIKDKQHQAAIHSCELAAKMVEVIKENPLLWEYSTQKFSRIYSSFYRDTYTTVDVFDNDHRLIYREEYSEPSYLKITGVSPLKYNNRVYGQVEITEDSNTVVYLAGVMYALFSGLGLIIGVSLYRFPTRMVIREENEVTRIYKELKYITFSLGEGVCVTDPKGCLIFTNPAAQHMLGWSAGELLGRDIHETVFCNPCLELGQSPIYQTIELGVSSRVYEDTFVAKDGRVLPVSYVATPIYENGEVIGSVTVFHDITERKRIEEELHHRLELERLIGTISANFINLMTDEIDQGINSALRQVGEFIRGDCGYVFLFLGDGKIRKTHGWCAERVTPIKKCNVSTTVKFTRSTLQVPMFYGKAAIGLLRFDLHDDEKEFSTESAPLLKIVGELFANALEHKRSDLALKENEAALRRVTDNMLDMISQTDKEGVLQYVTPSIKNLLGYEPEELLGKSAFDIVHKDDRDRMGTAIRNSAKAGLPAKLEFRCKHADGHYLWVEALGNYFFDNNGKISGVIFSSRDITEQKRLQQEVAHLDRLHLVGEMAAGIGHEIRNPMTAVRGFLQILGEKEENAPYKQYYDLMIDELDRANSIIKEYLNLAKNKMINLETQNLNTIVEAIFPLIEANALLADKHVFFELGETPDLLLDEKEIRQLILNLTRNGLEAMREGGHLVIKTYTEQEHIAVLSVKDQGEGIDTKLIDRIGTPFFTTKEQGTGLGLAICYSIAARHNAKIKIATGPEGTNFIVRFDTRKNRVEHRKEESRTENKNNGAGYDKTRPIAL